MTRGKGNVGLRSVDSRCCGVCASSTTACVHVCVLRKQEVGERQWFPWVVVQYFIWADLQEHSASEELVSWSSVVSL